MRERGQKERHKESVCVREREREIKCVAGRAGVDGRTAPAAAPATRER